MIRNVTCLIDRQLHVPSGLGCRGQKPDRHPPLLRTPSSPQIKTNSRAIQTFLYSSFLILFSLLYRLSSIFSVFSYMQTNAII